MKSISVIPDIKSYQRKDLPLDIQIPCNQKKLKSCLEPFLGQEISKENLLKMKQNVVQYFVDQDDSILQVQIPEQKVIDGNICIETIFARVQDITVTGNHWHKTSSFQKLFHTKELREKELLNQTAWINRNPNLHLTSIISPGEGDQTANLEIAVKDSFPVKLIVGSDNLGGKVRGENRFFAGVNIGLGLFAHVNYQVSSSYETPENLSHFASLDLSLPWMHELKLMGAYSEIRPEMKDFSHEGKDYQISGRYTLPFKPLYKPFKHELTLGMDYKWTDSSLFFLGDPKRIPIHQKRAALNQLFLSYKLSDYFSGWNIHFTVDLLASPISYLPSQTERAYNTIREGSKTRYLYSRAAIGAEYKLIKNLLRIQASSLPLLPSEMYGLGGFDTVRGFNERIFLADNVAVNNFEMRAPILSFSRKKWDELTLLVFFDAAYGYNFEPSLSFARDTLLLGAGPEIRYQIRPYASLKMAYGFQINTDEIGRFHFSLSASY